MCEYCGRRNAEANVAGEDLHLEACPVITGLFDDWKEGFDWGWMEMTDRVYCPESRSETYFLGLKLGLKEINRLADIAADEREMYPPEY